MLSTQTDQCTSEKRSQRFYLSIVSFNNSIIIQDTFIGRYDTFSNAATSTDHSSSHFIFITQPNNNNNQTMALQLGLRRGITSAALSRSSKPALGAYASTASRWKSTDAGDVIGIDLGTTNSCVAIMVRRQHCCVVTVSLNCWDEYCSLLQFAHIL
jgi:hypothetical protein